MIESSTPRPNVIDVSGIDFTVASPGKLTRLEWKQIRAFTQDVWEDQLPEGPKVHNVAGTGTGTVSGFINSRAHPETVFENQLFKHVRIVRAHEGTRLVGTSFSADNTSGPTALVRGLKMLTPPALAIPKYGGRRYLHVRELLVDQDYRERGIGNVLLGLTLEGHSMQQPVRAYVWPEYCPDVPFILTNLGFCALNAQSNIITTFGSDNSPVRQTPYVATVGQVQAFQQCKPGFMEAMARVET